MLNKLFLGVAIAAATLLSAKGDIIPSLSNVTAANGGFRWDYSANVTLDQEVRTGDYFTIYDFGSIQPGSNTQPAGWVFSSSLLGVTPSNVLPTDNPNILNLTWTYTGTATLTGPQFLGSFSVITNTNQLSAGGFAAQGTRATGPFAGSKISNVGTVAVPVPEMSALAPIIGVSGLATIGFFSSVMRRRRQG